ncbi:MAG: hypothetical protein ACPGTU_12840 [Myxococcota bacterium]
MSPIILATALLILGVAALLAGCRGIHVARKITKDNGPNTLVHYPAPIPWLRTKVTSARWVSWIGRLYAVTGLVLIGAGSTYFFQSAGDPRLRPCMELLDTISLETAIHTPTTRRASQNARMGCQVNVVDQEGVVWVTVSATPSDTMIGDSFGHQTQELTRKGFEVTPLTIPARRSVLGRPPKGGAGSPVVIIDEVDGCNTIEFHPIVASEALIQKTISTLHSKQTSKPPPGM